MEIQVEDGATLHYETAGEGEPLLWLHGFMGTGSDWRYIFGQPPTGYRVIAPDLRGHGRSTNPAGAFSFRQCANDIIALLGHLNLPRIKAVGLSGGGVTLLHMATAQPASLTAMVLVSAPPYFPARARTLQRQLSETMIPPAEMEMMRAKHPRGEEQIAQLFEYGRALADRYDDVNFTPPYLSTITADTLIVFGDRDPLYPVTLATELHQAIPGAFLWVVPNGGHGPVFGDAAPAFVETALSFLGGEWTAGRTPEAASRQ